MIEGLPTDMSIVKKLEGMLTEHEPLIGVDLGAAAIKVVGLDHLASTPTLTHLGRAAMPADVFSGHTIARVDSVAAAITALFEQREIPRHRVVLSIPSAAVFSKRIKIPQAPWGELRGSVELEAGNLIPHSLDAVKLDFHVIGEAPKEQLDVLLLAVKNEVIESFLAPLERAGLSVAIVDIDGCALANVAERVVPGFAEKRLAVVHLGCRGASIAIVREGEPMLFGNMGVGSRHLGETLKSMLSISPQEVDAMLDGSAEISPDVQAMLTGALDPVGQEVNRQLTLLWSASAIEEGVDGVFLSGGLAPFPGVREVIEERTGVPTTVLDPFAGVTIPSELPAPPSLGPVSQFVIAMGAAMRAVGDRVKYRSGGRGR